MASKKRQTIDAKPPTTKNSDVKKQQINEAANKHTSTILGPTLQASVTIKEYSKSLGELDLSALQKDLSDQVNQVNNGDLVRGEAMLTAQAQTLDLIFNRLARIAIKCEHMDKLEKFLKLSLKAQSQCRSTWEALSEIKHPRSVNYVTQANISQGHQQVNNTVTEQKDTPHARENKKSQNKLLEKNNGKRLDTRTTGKTSENDSTMAAVEKSNGT